MKVGIVGTGNMGGMLIRSFIQSGALTPKQLHITNRTVEKMEKFKVNFPSINLEN